MTDAAPPQSTRERVLGLIRTTSAPATVEELAAGLDLHANTVRSHIAGLEEEGLIRAEPRSDGGRGRPRLAYRPTAEGAWSGRRSYSLLAGALIDHVVETATDPEEAAWSAGRSWGTRLRESRAGRAHAARLTVDLLEEMGFEPQPHPVRRPREVRLRNCPFAELVDSHGRLVCAVHAGMLAGLAADADRDVSLRPFDTPHTCLVTLADPS